MRKGLTLAMQPRCNKINGIAKQGPVLGCDSDASAGVKCLDFSSCSSRVD
ncbi:hypothetical protein F441_02838 [Phytophthora nicotianae CJ01A1]|uniref:Uncharacterized protein n=2 Tax=Phytophthora nicotianae TaxID=4792 RepID=W2JM81_PHYNI|nr:hypothetical protein L915_02743 [Phytophthora nicotianae]ETL47545.1 hypothetical protein L916_02716 [Phytophthora nicotianae]ETP24116.1 hypothetical protein F441_02838 [Phytophthora nicotianae CJ01A1]